MRNLLEANLFRLFRSWMFRGAILVMMGGAMAICVSAYYDMVLYNEPARQLQKIKELGSDVH